MSFPKKIVHVVSHGAFLEKNPNKKPPHGQLLTNSLGRQNLRVDQLRDDVHDAEQQLQPWERLSPQDAAAAAEIRSLPRRLHNNNTEAVAPWKLVESNDPNDTKKYQDDYKFHYNTEQESAMQQLWNKFRNMHSTSQIPDKINIPVIETTPPGSSSLVPTNGFDLNLIKSLKDFLVAKNNSHGDLDGNDRKIMGSRSNIPDRMIDAIIGNTSEEINIRTSLKRKNDIVPAFGNNQFEQEEKKYYRDNNNILGYPYDIRMYFPQTFQTSVFNQRDQTITAGRQPTKNTDPDADNEYFPDASRSQLHPHDPRDQNKPRLPLPPPNTPLPNTPNWTHGRSISIISGPRPEIEKTQNRTAENATRGDPYRTEVQKGGIVRRLGGTTDENNFYTKGNSKESPGMPDYISKDGTKKISLSDYSRSINAELKPNALNWGIHELDFNKIEIDVRNTSPPQGITDIIALLRETIPIDQKALESIRGGSSSSSIPQPNPADYVETVKNILKKIIHDSFENLRPANPVNQHERHQANETIKTAIIIGQFSRSEQIFQGNDLSWYLNGGPVRFVGNTYDVSFTRPYLHDWYQNNIKRNRASEPLIKNDFNIADYIELSLTLNTQIKNNGEFESIDNQNFLKYLFGSMDTNNAANQNNVLQRIIDKLIESEYLEDILLNTVNNTLRNFRENQYIISDKLENSDEQTINNIPLSNWFVHGGTGNHDLRSIRDTRDCLDRWNQFTEAELDRIKQRQNSKVLIHESFSEYKPPQQELEYLRENRLINKPGYIDDFTYEEATTVRADNFIKKGKYKISKGLRRNSPRHDIDSRFLSIKFRTGSPRPDSEGKNVTPTNLGTEYKFVKGAFVVWLNGTGDNAQAEMGVLMENANSCGVPGTREVKVRKCSDNETINKRLNELYARLYNPDGGIMFLERTQLKTNVNLYSMNYTAPQNQGSDGILTWTKDKDKSLKAGTSFYTFIPNSFQILDYYVNVERTWPVISSNVCRDPAHTTPYYMTSLSETPGVEQEGFNCYNDLWRETSYGIMNVHPPPPSPPAPLRTNLGPNRNPGIRNKDLNNNNYCKKEITITQTTPESFVSEMYKKFPVTQLYTASHAAKTRAYWEDKESRNVSVMSGIAAGDRVSRISQDNRERIIGSEYIGEMTLDQRNAEDFREAEQRD